MVNKWHYVHGGLFWTNGIIMCLTVSIGDIGLNLMKNGSKSIQGGFRRVLNNPRSQANGGISLRVGQLGGQLLTATRKRPGVFIISLPFLSSLYHLYIASVLKLIFVFVHVFRERHLPSCSALRTLWTVSDFGCRGCSTTRSSLASNFQVCDGTIAD